MLRDHRRTTIAVVTMLLAVLLIECVAFNLPYWRTRGASTDSAAYENTMGAGLERTDDGMLHSIDQTAAWLEVETDGSSDYARIDLVTVRGTSAPRSMAQPCGRLPSARNRRAPCSFGRMGPERCA